MTLWAALITAAANLRMGRLWRHRRLLAEQKAGLHQGPVISPTMREAAKARRRVEARRRRQQEQKEARARGRPPD